MGKGPFGSVAGSLRKAGLGQPREGQSKNPRRRAPDYVALPDPRLRWKRSTAMREARRCSDVFDKIFDWYLEHTRHLSRIGVEGRVVVEPSDEGSDDVPAYERRNGIKLSEDFDGVRIDTKFLVSFSKSCMSGRDVMSIDRPAGKGDLAFVARKTLCPNREDEFRRSCADDRNQDRCLPHTVVCFRWGRFMRVKNIP